MPKNRYGDTYYYEWVKGNTYIFVISSEQGFMRYGGKEGQLDIDMSDLGMFDPPGGPYVSIGSYVFWDEVVHADEAFGCRQVTHIELEDGEIYVTLAERQDSA